MSNANCRWLFFTCNAIVCSLTDDSETFASNLSVLSKDVDISALISWKHVEKLISNHGLVDVLRGGVGEEETDRKSVV